jgi:integrase/recombinase XerD
MSIRPLNKQRTKWQIDFYPAGQKGKRQRSTMVGTEIEAMQFELAVRRIHAEDTPANPRIGDAVHQWISKCKTNKSQNTVIDIEKFQKNQLNFFTSIRFTMLTGTHIEKYKKKRLEDGVKPRTINKELSYLSGLITYAVKENYCNPLPFKIEQIPSANSPDPDLLSWDEISSLIDHLEDKYLCILLLFADTALRKVEALRMTAERINIPTGTFRVKGKNGKDETLPIPTKRLRIALEKIVNDVGGKGFLFINPNTGRPYTTIRKALKRAALSAKINKRVYHHLFRCQSASDLDPAPASWLTHPLTEYQ